VTTHWLSNTATAPLRQKPAANSDGNGRLTVVSTTADAPTVPARTRSIYRAPIVSPQVASSNALDRHLREELEYTRRTLEAFARELTNDPIMQTRYRAGLESLGLATQTLGHLAQIIGSEDKAQAVSQSSMKGLNARLLRGDMSMLSEQAESNLHGSGSSFAG